MPIHTRQVAPLQAVASLSDRGTASRAHLNASWKASAMSLWPLISASPNLQTARAPTGVVSSTHWPLFVCNSPSALGERKLLLRAVIERATVASLLQPGLLASPEQLRSSSDSDTPGYPSILPLASLSAASLSSSIIRFF